MAIAAHRHAGFTLLEMLVVVVLIGVLGSVVAVSFSGDVGRQARKEADRLEQALQMAADEAVFQGVEMGAYFTQVGYGFLRYDNATQRWQEVKDKGLRAYRLGGDARLRLALDSKMVALPAEGVRVDHPAVLFLSSGELSAFQVGVSSGDSMLMLGTDGIAPIAQMAGR